MSFNKEKAGPTVTAVNRPETKKQVVGKSVGYSNSITALLENALYYGAQGLDIIPCIGKRPLTTRGHHDATHLAQIISDWWAKWPYANIGLVIQPHFLVLDFDVRNEQTPGEHEQLKALLPETLTVVSGRNDGGVHMYFQRPNSPLSAQNLPKGIDLKLNGYVMAPPSIHPATGLPYTEGVIAPMAELPTSVTEQLRPAQQVTHIPTGRSTNLTGLVRAVTQSVPGNRNHALYWAACRAFENGDAALINELFEAALGVGLSELETAATINSAQRTVSFQEVVA